jgi:ubiquinone/menaquinone biosynthesis C-methylase UbiE
MTKESIGIPEEPKPRIIVEIGAGQRPAPKEGARDMGNNDIYIGIDPERDLLDIGRGDTLVERKIAGGEGKLAFVAGKGEELPIREGTADEVIIGNLFGEPRVGFEEKKAILRQAAGALKEHGRLVVKENYTPMELTEWEALAADLDLKEERLVGQHHPEFQELMARYHGGQFAMPGSYFLIFRKESKVNYDDPRRG